ncbi:MAG TPA: hypothetical protein VJ233_04925 [Hyphomicrobiaceae bacterium]|nr:hypothetical protein [Hyphomicrobiaceae bacterium]
MAAKISMGARREVMSAIAERHRSAERMEKGRILDELRAVTGRHREHAVRALAKSGEDVTPQSRHRRRCEPARNCTPVYTLALKSPAGATDFGAQLEVKRPKMLETSEGTLSSSQKLRSGAN